MARTLPTAVSQLKATQSYLDSYAGVAGELIWNVDKKTWMGMDGTQVGGHAMAKAAQQVTADNATLKVNGGASATLGADIAISLVPTGVAEAVKSTDAGNSIQLGSDGKLFVAPLETADTLVAADDKIVKVDDAGKIATGLSLAYDPSTGKFTILGHDGVTEVDSVTVPSSTSALENVTLVVNPTDPETQTPLTGTYIDFDFVLADGSDKHILVNVTDLIDVYTAGNGITINGKVVSLKTVASQPIYTDASGNVALGLGDGLQNVAGTDHSSVAVKLAADNNQMLLDATGAMYVPMDYGTLE